MAVRPLRDLRLPASVLPAAGRRRPPDARRGRVALARRAARGGGHHDARAARRAPGRDAGRRHPSRDPRDDATPGGAPAPRPPGRRPLLGAARPGGGARLRAPAGAGPGRRLVRHGGPPVLRDEPRARVPLRLLLPRRHRGRAVRRGLGTRPRGRAPGVRALRRLARRAAPPPSGPARLPLRALRAHRADAAHGAARHARDRDRRPPPRRGARRPLPRDQAGAPRLGRELLDQGDREALRVRAHRRRRRRRRVDRPLRGVGRDRQRDDPRGGRALQRGGLPLDVRAPRVAARDPPARPAVARPAGAPPAQGGARPARRGAGGARGAAARRCRGGHAATPPRAPRRLPPARGAPAVVGLVPLAAARRRRARRRPDGDRPARVGRPAAGGRRDEPRVSLHVPRAGAQARDEGVRPGHAARLSVGGRRRPRRRDAVSAGQARGGAAATRV